MLDSSGMIRETVVLKSAHFRVTEFELATRHSLIPVIRAKLLDGIQEFQLATSPVENHFCMALEEALANAFFHGNLELCSSLKEDCSTRFLDLAAEREQQLPYSNRRIHITQAVGRPGMWITIRDEGRGFNVAAVMERCNDPETLLSSGRGLMMMHALTDELFFNNAGNEVTLVLYGRSEDRELPIATADSVKNSELERCLVFS